MQKINCKFCGSKMVLVGYVSNNSPKNYMCECGAHRYESNLTKETWFTKPEWIKWVESYKSVEYSTKK